MAKIAMADAAEMGDFQIYPEFRLFFFFPFVEKKTHLSPASWLFLSVKKFGVMIDRLLPQDLRVQYALVAP